MDVKSRVLGPVSVRWDDYIGTAAADDAEAVMNQASLYELAGINREIWHIIGIDIVIHQSVPDVTVYATRRGAPDPSEFDQGYEVVVQPFNIPTTRVDDFLNGAFRQIAIRLVARTMQDRTLVVGGG
jgi:hypothetical protein